MLICTIELLIIGHLILLVVVSQNVKEFFTVCHVSQFNIVQDIGQPHSRGLSSSQCMGQEEERPWEQGWTLVRSKHLKGMTTDG